MKFRPCIDIHNGKVKQIVGGSLKDAGDAALENFVSGYDAAYYARLYKNLGLTGGHIIILNPAYSEYYEKDAEQALSALKAWPGNLQIGGGINPDNAGSFLDAGASHVIVTSYVFSNGIFNEDNLKKLLASVGKKRLVLDLSCRKKGGQYYIVTDRWQKFTEHCVTPEFLDMLTGFCDEFLIHAVDAEGKASGIEEELVAMLAKVEGFPSTYAGGVGSYDDILRLKTIGKNAVDVTVGSALDMFGGKLEFHKVVDLCRS
jgi:phosphoribosylformimino-5-aminoimidazole carboxamide ribotide isomerase